MCIAVYANGMCACVHVSIVCVCVLACIHMPMVLEENIEYSVLFSTLLYEGNIFH